MAAVPPVRQFTRLCILYRNRLRSVHVVIQLSKRTLVHGHNPILPLHGVRILDLTRVLAGPFATQLLGDLGADVIKIEHPNDGDMTRAWGPPFTTQGHESAYFLSANRNKKSVAIDMSSDEGQTILHELVTKSDVLVENFVPWTLNKYKMDYQHIHNRINPKLIYCSVTGFSSKGPYSHRAGYDVIVQAMGGLMDITGDERPAKTGVALIDQITGLYAHSAILAALRSRDMDPEGMGQKIDVNLFDSCLTSLSNLAMSYLISDGDITPERMGTAHPQIVPYQAFETKEDNEYFVIGAGTDAAFKKMCGLMVIKDGNEDIFETLHVDGKFSDNAQRVRNRTELIDVLQNRFNEKTLDEWCVIFGNSGIPHGPVNSMRRAFEDNHVKEKEIVQYVEHSTAGEIPLLRLPVEYSKDTEINKIKLAPPVLGEHTHQVLSQVLGYDEEWITSLQKKGVIAFDDVKYEVTA
eukprot:97218_1